MGEPLLKSLADTDLHTAKTFAWATVYNKARIEADGTHRRVIARAESRAPNAMTLPRFAVLIALAGRLLHSPALALVGLGAMFSAIPAATVRGAGEMERPLASSLAWSALIAGAALSAMI